MALYKSVYYYYFAVLNSQGMKKITLCNTKPPTNPMLYNAFRLSRWWLMVQSDTRAKTQPQLLDCHHLVKRSSDTGRYD